MDQQAIHVAPPGDTIKVINSTHSDHIERKRSREVLDLQALVTYLTAWGDPELGTIYWNDAGVVAILDEQDMKSGQGKQDTVSFGFTRPVPAQRWLDAIGKVMTHKEFKAFLELRHQEIEGGSGLFTRICNLSLAQTFTYDGKLDSDQVYQVAFKSEAGADVTTIPKHIVVSVPLVSGLAMPFTLNLRLRFKAPTKPDESPSFWVEWDDKKEVLEDAARAASVQIQDDLPAWCVVHGRP